MDATSNIGTNMIQPPVLELCRIISPLNQKSETNLTSFGVRTRGIQTLAENIRMMALGYSRPLRHLDFIHVARGPVAYRGRSLQLVPGKALAFGRPLHCLKE